MINLLSTNLLYAVRTAADDDLHWKSKRNVNDYVAHIYSKYTGVPG